MVLLRYVSPPMLTDAIARIATSRPVKILLVLGVLCVAGAQALPYVVDARPYTDAFSKAVGDVAGAKVLVKNGGQLQLMPHPALILKSVEIMQPDVPKSPTVIIDQAEIQFSLLSLPSGSPKVQKVLLRGVAMTAEKQADKHAQWGFLGMGLLKKLAAMKPSNPIAFELAGGSATVADVAEGASEGVSRINASGVSGENSAISGVAEYEGKAFHFSATRKGTIGATPVTLSLDNGAGNSLSLDGSMDFTADHPVITGKLDVNAADVTQFTAGQAAPDAAPASPGMPVADKAVHDAVPLKLSADYVQNEQGINLNNLTLDVIGSKATGSLIWQQAEAKDGHKLSLDFSTFDIVKARALFGVFAQPAKDRADDSHAPLMLAPKDFDLLIEMRAAQVMNGSQAWSKANFSGAVSDGVLTVNQLVLALPGDSTLTLFGLLSVTDTQGLRFEGNTEAQGSSLRDLLTVFDESASNLPQLGFGAYKLRSNLFISKELLRLSEADAKFSELSFKGGMVAYFDKKPRLEAEIGLRDIDFDYFRNSWREANKDAEDQRVFLRFDKDMNFDWLKKLSASIDFKVDVQGFNFLERKGKSASFRLFAQAGEIGVYNAKFNYDNDITEANLKLDVSGAVPAINLVLNTSDLNTSYFMLHPAAYKKVVEPVKPVAELKEPLPEIPMPDANSEEELRQKIAEEAAAMQAQPPVNAPVVDVEAPVVAAPAPAPAAAPAPSQPDELLPPDSITPAPADSDASDKPAPQASTRPVELKPLISDPELDNTQTITTTEPQSLVISEAFAQAAAPQDAPITLAAASPDAPADATGQGRWTDTPINMSLIEGINGNFDISVARLQHEGFMFQNVKFLAKLERNLLSIQTLTFMHWGGSMSINGTIFGGQVPGMSLGFILASVDIKQMLESLIGVNTINGRTSISGTFDTSGVNLLSWVTQANAKMLFAGRGVAIQGLDVASVLSAVSASRTAADVFNSVNVSLSGGAGEYTVDGAANLQRGVISMPGLSIRTGRIVGNIQGDFRLLPWDIGLTGTFKFPELSAENAPSLIVRWSGPVNSPQMQTDTQALEAFVSKRIIGN